MSTFALSSADTQEDVIGALNYALSNLGSTVSGNITYSGNILVANTTTGVISSVTSTGTTQVPVISYLYGYVNVKYANSASGSSGFTSNSAYANYYGVHNTTDGSISSNPTDYNWTQVAGGFGATKQLYYTTGGGNTVNFNVSTGVPSIYYTPVLDNTPIQLAIIGNSAVVANSIQPRVITNVQIAGNTIQGQNIQLGTITANLLAANSIFVSQSLQSTNATFNSPTSAGFWLNATNGSARFGSSINVGDSLTVGNNASIGGNLNVSGLITTGGLNSNTVSTTTIVNQAVSIGNAATSTTAITISNPTANTPRYYTYANVTINLASTAGISNYISGVLATDQTVDVSYGTSSFVLTFYLYRNSPGSNTVLLAQTFRYEATLTQSRWNNIVPFSYLDTGLSAGVDYTYSLLWATSTGGLSMPTAILKSGTLVCQILKR